MYVGRNCKTINQCVDEGIDYLTSDWDRLEELKTILWLDHKASNKERKDFLLDFEFDIHKHKDRI